MKILLFLAQLKAINMNRLVFFWLIVLVYSCHSEPVLQKGMSHTDSMQVMKLKGQKRVVMLSDPDSFMKIMAKLLLIYQRNNYNAELMNCYSELGRVALESDHPVISKKYADSMMLLAVKKGNEHLLYLAYENYGHYYSAVNNYERAAYFFLKSLALQPKGPVDSTFYINVHSSLAYISYRQNNRRAAFEFYAPIILYAERNTDIPFRINIYLNAIAYFDRNNKEGRIQAVTYLFAAKKEAEAYGDTTCLNMVYTSLAEYYFNSEQFGVRYQSDSVQYYGRQAIAYIPRFRFNTQYVHSFILMARDYLEVQGNFEKAEEIINRLDAFTPQLDSADLEIKSEYYDLKYRIAKKKHNLAAIVAYLEKKSELDKKSLENEKDEQLVNYQEKVKKITTEKRLAEKDNEIEKQKIYTISLIIFCILVILLAMAIFQHFRNKRKLEKEILLDNQQKKEFESQRKLFEERSRIACEMHDDLGSTLTSTIMALELIKQKPGASGPLIMMEHSANRLSCQINEIIWNMNVHNDNLESLSDYMLRFASAFLKEAGIQFSWTEDLTETNVPISGQQRRIIYLCGKELINNIVKHAEATKVQLDIKYSSGQLTVNIEDNGLGLEGSKSSSAGSGNGLFNIRNRIAGMNGQITWQHGNPGTHVEIIVPVG
jgi:signal transduction histidine kinase